MSLEEHTKEQSIGLFSEDGIHWKGADGTRTGIEWELDFRVTRIVIGTPEKPKSDEASAKDKGNNDTEKSGLTSLPDNFADLYPNLTHLHIWGQTKLVELPELQAGLIGLDLRFSNSLESLPALPKRLELLDLGGCESIFSLPPVPNSLQRCYLNDCKQLLATDLRKCESMVEFDASESPYMHSLKTLPRSIAKLVLAGCQNLDSVEGIEDFKNLKHLNLSACPKLISLPEIPDDIQYLALHSSDQLKYYKNQTLGPYDRGSEDEPNVASRLYVRKVFGQKLAPSAQAKLLFLGDGRVGKTTLSKALQWNTLSEQERQSGQYDALKPDRNEQYTRDIRFDNWQTALELDVSLAEKVNEKANSAGLAPVFTEAGRCDGTIRMWDFAGQELYHQTHRIFAAEGSVFVLVWSVDTSAAVDSSKRDVSEEEWVEWNRQRSLDYWLEYIESIRPDASITIVCTRCTDAEPDSWKKRAPKCNKRFGHVKDFYIDSLEPGDLSDEDNEFRGLVEHLRKECGREAHRLGILQPEFYSVVRSQLDQWVSNNMAAMTDERVLLRQYSDWSEDLKQLDPAIPLSPVHIEGITGYLNDAGMLVRIQSNTERAVLIDQSWAASVIYKLLHRPPGGSLSEECLFNEIRKGEGVFYQNELDRVEEWKKIDSEVEKNTLLNYMEQCGIIARILEPHQNRSGDQAMFLATEKWLLPEYDQVENTLVKIYRHVRSTQGTEQLEFSFESKLISEFDFRKLMVHLAKTLGQQMLFFRNGLQVTDNIAGPTWCFQIAWHTEAEGDFYGVVDASLATAREKKEELIEQFENLITSPGSPFHKKTMNVSGGSIELQEVKIPFINTAERDVGISSTGAPYDQQVVSALISELRASGISEYWYKSLGENDDERTLKVMERLPRQRILLLLVSPDYMYLDSSNPGRKWFCMYELADAIIALGSGKLSANKVVVAFVSSPVLDAGFDFDNFIDNFKETAARNLRLLRSHFFSAAATETATQESVNEVLGQHFSDAIRSNGFDEFFSDRTRTGAYKVVKNENPDISELVERLKLELASGR